MLPEDSADDNGEQTDGRDGGHLSGIYVSVVDDHFQNGVNGPSPTATYDWREPPGSPGNTAKIKALFTSVPLVEALETHFKTHKHFTAYSVADERTGRRLKHHPRINNPGLEWAEQQGYVVRCHMLIADVDHPRDGGPKGPKKPWDLDLYEAWLDVIRHRVMDRAAWFHTRHGWRVIQLLDRGLEPDKYKELATGWHASLRAAGARDVDPKCVSWNHCYVLPRAQFWHDGKRVTLDYQPFYDDARPMSPEAIRRLPGFEVPDGLVRARVTGSGPRSARPSSYSDVLPEPWDAAARTIGHAARAASLPGRTHDILLFLAGSLVKHDVPGGLIPEFVERVARVAGVSDPMHHRYAAEDTVEKSSSVGKKSVAGDKPLSEATPELLAVVLDSVATAIVETTPVEPPIDPMTVAEMGERLFQRLRHGAAGTVVIAAELGSGKSHQARRVAAELDRIALLGRLGGRKRDAPGLHTVFSAPTHALALEHTRRLRDGGTPVLRLFSPPSLRDADGNRVCIHHEAARPLQEAGVSIAKEFCSGRGKTQQRCAVYDTCPARDGTEGPPDAAVVIGPYQLLGRLQGYAGSQGLVVVDEPPVPVETKTVTLQQLADTLAYGGMMGRYQYAMRPLLDALRRFTERIGDPGGAALSLEQALALCANSVSEADADDAERVTGVAPQSGMASALLEWARAAIPPPPPGGRPQARSPIVTWSRMAAARESPAMARQLGPVLATYTVAQQIADDSIDVRVWVNVDESGTRSLVVKRPDRLLRGVLQRQGIVALLDATPAPLLGALESLAQSPPEVLRLPVLDGAAVARTHMVTRGGRSALFVDHLPDPEKLVPRLKAVATWISTGTSTGKGVTDSYKVGVVSFMPISMALRAASPDAKVSGEAVTEWQAKEWPMDRLYALTAPIQALLGPWLGSMLTMHYGACRGLDSFHQADIDALVTLGDPWDQLDDTYKDAQLFNLDGDLLAKQRCLAELTQAQGRLRAPQLTRPKRALHVGRERPQGHGWDDTSVSIIKLHESESDDPVVLLQACVVDKTENKVCEELGINHSTLRQYVERRCGMPDEVQRMVREARQVRGTDGLSP